MRQLIVLGIFATTAACEPALEGDEAVLDAGTTLHGNTDAATGDAGATQRGGPAADASSYGGGSSGSGISTANPTVNHPTVHLDGGLPASSGLLDFDAGPVLNPTIQATCLKLAKAICDHVADCDQSVAHVSAAQQTTAIDACTKSFQRAHNCNRAINAASDFDQCVTSVASIDCDNVLGGDISSTCVDKLTYRP